MDESCIILSTMEWHGEVEHKYGTFIISNEKSILEGDLTNLFNSKIDRNAVAEYIKSYIRYEYCENVFIPLFSKSCYNFISPELLSCRSRRKNSRKNHYTGDVYTQEWLGHTEFK